MTAIAIPRPVTGTAVSGSAAVGTGDLCSEFIRISAPMEDAVCQSKRRSLWRLHPGEGHLLVDVPLQLLRRSHVGVAAVRVTLDALDDPAGVERGRILRIDDDRFLVVSKRPWIVLLAEVQRAATL